MSVDMLYATAYHVCPAVLQVLRPVGAYQTRAAKPVVGTAELLPIVLTAQITVALISQTVEVQTAEHHLVKDGRRRFRHPSVQARVAVRITRRVRFIIIMLKDDP